MYFCITWGVSNVKKVLTVDLELCRKNQLPLDVTLQKIVPYISIHGLSQKQLKFFFSQSRLFFVHNQVYCWRRTYFDLPQWLYCNFEVQKPRWQTKFQDEIAFQIIFWSIGTPFLADNHQISTSLGPVACEKYNWALTRHKDLTSSSHVPQYSLIDSKFCWKLIQHHIFGGLEMTNWSFCSNYRLLVQLSGTVT